MDKTSPWLLRLERDGRQFERDGRDIEGKNAGLTTERHLDAMRLPHF